MCLTSHVRDTAVWRVPEGAAVQWVRMGDGNIGIDEYVRKYQRLCPGRALSLEIIVTQPRIYPYLDPKFWDGYRTTPAWEFSRYLNLVEKGNLALSSRPCQKKWRHNGSAKTSKPVCGTRTSCWRYDSGSEGQGCDRNGRQPRHR